MKLERNIVAPFCIFFIVMGAGGVVILPMINVIYEFSKEDYNRIFDIIWIVGAVTALLYSLFVLKEFLSKSYAEKIIYCFLVVIFFVLIFIPVFR
ncbi:uncharacterized protein Dvar_69530 [Desulfosarcina variabilis str. Montpellier]|uniref:hypothetical protein n=1 Tax=Desulfosarcina variabilis TaxID=2300 RepID=UPI003AFACB7F